VRRRAGRVARLGLAVALFAGCAPRPTAVVPVTEVARAARYLRQLARREERATMVEGAATVWLRAFAACDTCAPRRLPAAQAGVALAWPDRMRLSVGSAFGTALDLGLAGDSLTAYAPPQGWAVALDATRDSLGLADPGALAVRALSAGWRPPGSAWDSGTREGGLLVLRWSEEGDSVALAVDESGIPVWARLGRDARRGVMTRYERWESTDGVAWPVAFQVRELGGAFELACRLDGLRFAPAPARPRLAVRIPPGADVLGRERLRDLLEHLGRGR